MQAKLDAEAKLDEPSPVSPASNGSTSHSQQLSSIPFVGVPSNLMQRGMPLAHAWDLDPSEIAVCKRPDGSDWLLGTGSFGQVSLCLCASAAGFDAIQEAGSGQLAFLIMFHCARPCHLASVDLVGVQAC